ncbi:MAG: fibrinogen-binding protein, partial [Phycisphaerales bacterium]|nr:fibrinogen-binding protein [Phycisphaerales bacterium]
MTAARVELLERRSLLAAVTPVPTFGQNGVLAPSPAPTTETAESIDLAGVTAGGILVDQYSDQIDHNVIHRFTLNGKEDSTFTATALPIFDTTAKYTADAQGRAIYAYANNTASGIFVGRVKVNGGIDSGFGVNGQATVTVPTAAGEVQTGRSIDAVSAAPDGSIYVAVTVASQSTNGAISSKRRYVYKLTAAGVLDTSFGRLAFSGVRKNFFLSATPDNGVMAGYKLAASIYSLIKLTRTGQADSAFGDGGVSNVLEVNAAAYFTAAIDAQGRPIVTASTALGASIYRLTAGGQIDNTFGENGIVSGLGRNSTIKALLPQADGTLIAQVVLGVKSVLVKFRATGEPDRTFDTDGVLDIHDGDTVSPVVAALPGNQFLSFASFPIGSGYTLQKLAVVVGGHNVTLNSNGTLQFVGDTADDKVVVSLTTP